MKDTKASTQQKDLEAEAVFESPYPALLAKLLYPRYVPRHAYVARRNSSDKYSLLLLLLLLHHR